MLNTKTKNFSISTIKTVSIQIGKGEIINVGDEVIVYLEKATLQGEILRINEEDRNFCLDVEDVLDFEINFYDVLNMEKVM
jgi:hypothetical protein